MRNRFFTVLILRHARPRFRQLRLSYLMVAVLVLVGSTLLAAGLLAPSLWFESRDRSVDLDRLAFEVRELRNERDYYQGALSQMADRLGAFEQQTRRLATELEIELPAGEIAGGAVEHKAATNGELRWLQARTESLDGSFAQLDSSLQERLRMLAATPDGLPVDGWFSHGFGWRKDPFTGERQFHRGIDIVAEAGTDIVAPADGVVSRFGYYSDYGRSIDLNHGYGYVTRYAHMSEVLVRPGDSVQRGDVLGRVGSSGRSTGPHLHYELFRDGRRANPWTYLGQERR